MSGFEKLIEATVVCNLFKIITEIVNHVMIFKMIMIFDNNDYEIKISYEKMIVIERFFRSLFVSPLRYKTAFTDSMVWNIPL